MYHTYRVNKDCLLIQMMISIGKILENKYYRKSVEFNAKKKNIYIDAVVLPQKIFIFCERIGYLRPTCVWSNVIFYHTIIMMSSNWISKCEFSDFIGFSSKFDYFSGLFLTVLRKKKKIMEVQWNEIYVIRSQYSTPIESRQCANTKHTFLWFNFHFFFLSFSLQNDNSKTIYTFQLTEIKNVIQ